MGKIQNKVVELTEDELEGVCGGGKPVGEIKVAVAVE